jgi:hypothetical protein
MVADFIQQTTGRSEMIEEVIEDKKEQVLKVIDRCDRCDAQAFVLVKGMTGELLFCGHHYNKIINDPEGAKKLNEFAYQVLDEREFIK